MRRLAILLLAVISVFAENLTTEQLEKYLEDKSVYFLDVREPKEIQENGSVPGYVNIPVGELEKRMSEVPKDKLIVTMCARGVRAAKAAEMLNKAGYKTLGSCGLNDYKQKGKKLVYPKAEAK